VPEYAEYDPREGVWREGLFESSGARRRVGMWTFYSQEGVLLETRRHEDGAVV
jgi:hypothetical protein